MFLKPKKYITDGFTIVELLVVIVVIGILAAITIVSYNGISQKANIASLQSDLENASKVLKLDQAQNNNEDYPLSLSVANSGKGVPASSGTTYQYQLNNSVTPKTFCITATKSNLSYYANNDSRPTVGGCPGDIVSGSPSLTNPSFESDTVGNGSYPANWTQYGMTGNSYEGIANDYASHGTKSFKISRSGSDMDGGIWARISGLTIGQNITVSLWIKTGAGVANANIVLCTSQHGLTGSQTVNNNQISNTEGRVSVTLNNVDQTAVDLFLGLGSFGYSSQGNVWFDSLQVTVE